MRRLMLVCAAWLVACSAEPAPTPTWPPPDATSRAFMAASDTRTARTLGEVAAMQTETARTLAGVTGPTPTPCR